jgi:hypothetical protein
MQNKSRQIEQNNKLIWDLSIIFLTFAPKTSKDSSNETFTTLNTSVGIAPLFPSNHDGPEG